jgi:hypothetical protein
MILLFLFDTDYSGVAIGDRLSWILFTYIFTTPSLILQGIFETDINGRIL